MRIYYFGELVEDSNKKDIENKSNLSAMEKHFDEDNTMKSVGDILKDLDMTIDTYRKRSALRIRNLGGHHYA